MLDRAQDDTSWDTDLSIALTLRQLQGGGGTILRELVWNIPNVHQSSSVMTEPFVQLESVLIDEARVQDVRLWPLLLSAIGLWEPDGDEMNQRRKDGLKCVAGKGRRHAQVDGGAQIPSSLEAALKLPVEREDYRRAGLFTVAVARFLAWPEA